MAETYGVYDWRALPLVTAATLAQGLPASSRVARKVSGNIPDKETLLLAIIADRLGHLCWMISEDGTHGENHPPSLLAVITGRAEDGEAQSGFDSGEAFFAAWKEITGGDDNA